MPRPITLTPTTPTVRLTLRIPAHLYQALQQVAQSEARSGHGQILAILQQQLAQPAGQGVRNGSQR